jgi:DNA-binding NarL/FixJ family response regulator
MALLNREPDLQVCGEAEDVDTAIEEILAKSPDVLIVDLSLKGRDGLEIVKTLRARRLEIPILMLSMYDELIYAEQSLSAGANGYIMKQEATEYVLRALRQILEGDVYVSVSVADRIIQCRGKSAVTPGPSAVNLSHRELEVLRLIGGGLSSREAAANLHLSVKTIETYQGHLKGKLGLSNNRELTHYAMRWVRTACPEKETHGPSIAN